MNEASVDSQSALVPCGFISVSGLSLRHAG